MDSQSNSNSDFSLEAAFESHIKTLSQHRPLGPSIVKAVEKAQTALVNYKTAATEEEAEKKANFVEKQIEDLAAAIKRQAPHANTVAVGLRECISRFQEDRAVKKNRPRLGCS